MGDKVELILEDRSVQGKAVKALRKSGYVPGVVYGHDIEPRSVMGPEVPMTKAFHQAGKHHPVELQLGKQKHLAMIKAVDIDPVKHKLRHLAFHVVKQNEKVETEVPIVIAGSGETVAEKAGLVILTTIESVEISALPSDLPDSIEAPGDKLTAVGDRLAVADLRVPQGVAILSDPEQVIATVYEPSALQAANDAAGGEAESADATAVESEHGEDTPQDTQDEENRPGGKKQAQPKE
jgi:large subunit ribosomal protein L25